MCLCVCVTCSHRMWELTTSCLRFFLCGVAKPLRVNDEVNARWRGWADVSHRFPFSEQYWARWASAEPDLTWPAAQHWSAQNFTCTPSCWATDWVSLQKPKLQFNTRCVCNDRMFATVRIKNTHTRPAWNATEFFTTQDFQTCSNHQI